MTWEKCLPNVIRAAIHTVRRLTRESITNRVSHVVQLRTREGGGTGKVNNMICLCCFGISTASSIRRCLCVENYAVGVLILKGLHVFCISSRFTIGMHTGNQVICSDLLFPTQNSQSCACWKCLRTCTHVTSGLKKGNKAFSHSAHKNLQNHSNA